MADQYKEEIIDPGDAASKLAKEIGFQSHSNCPAVRLVPHQPGNFRGPVGFSWRPHILAEMAKNTPVDWVMLEEVENDGAGGKPQFFTLVGTPAVFFGLGWEIIAMTADDFARSGRLPTVICNELNAKRITEKNFPLFQAAIMGYGSALRQAGLVNITGETAIIKHSITAFCDQGADEQLVLTWGATCIGLAHRDLLIDGSKIQADMPIVGFWEPGYRCNGGTFFTNLLLRRFGPDLEKIRKNEQAMAFAEKLTIPSKSYAQTVCRIIGWNPDGSIGRPLANIVGIAHVTGGGVWGKFGEILPKGVGAHLTHMPKPAEVLIEGQRLSWETDLRLTDWQAYSTFHGGCGMLLVCFDVPNARTVIQAAEKDGISASIVGFTTKSGDGEILIISRFREEKTLSSKNPE